MAGPFELSPDLLIGAHPQKELLAAGISRSELTGPLWRRLDQGLYAWAAASSSTPMDRILQVLPLIPEGGAIGGWAAAVVHGVRGMDGETWDEKQLPIQIVMSRHQTCRRTAGVRVHRSDLEPFERVIVDGVPVTSLERTAFDIARLEISPRDIAGPGDSQGIARRAVAPRNMAGRGGHARRAKRPATLGGRRRQASAGGVGGLD